MKNEDDESDADYAERKSLFSDLQRGGGSVPLTRLVELYDIAAERAGWRRLKELLDAEVDRYRRGEIERPDD